MTTFRSKICLPMSKEGKITAIDVHENIKLHLKNYKKRQF